MSQTSGATRRLLGYKGASNLRAARLRLGKPTSVLRDYGLASQARDTDGDGALIFTPEFPKADPYLIWKGARCVELKPNR